jgi:hypothetical protein
LYFVTVDATTAHEWLIMTCRSSLSYNFAEWGDIQSWLRFLLTGDVASDKIRRPLDRWLSSYAFMPRLFVNLRQTLMMCAIDWGWSPSRCNSIIVVNHTSGLSLWCDIIGRVVVMVRICIRSHEEMRQLWTGSSITLIKYDSDKGRFTILLSCSCSQVSTKVSE